MKEREKENEKQTENLIVNDKVTLAKENLTGLIPPGETFILVDDNQLGKFEGGEFYSLPFLEKNGEYWGLPADDDTAIRELERLRQDGASYIAFAWVAFWWLDYYAQFADHLDSHFPCIFQNELLILFGLREKQEITVTHTKQKRQKPKVQVETYQSSTEEAGVVCYGMYPLKKTIVKRFLNLSTTPLPTYHFSNSDMIGKATVAAQRYGLAVLSRQPTHILEDLKHQALRIPIYINQIKDLPKDVTELKTTFDQKRVKRALRRIRNQGYDWAVSRDLQMFSQFYHDFYLPSLYNRFGEEGVVDSFEQLKKWLDDGGELLIVRQNQEWVAASLNWSDECCYLMKKVAVRNGHFKLVKEGAQAATYYFSMLRACHCGFRRFSFGLSLPLLKDGILQFKAKWGSQLEIDHHSLGSTYFLLDPRHFAVQRFLAQDSLIFLDGEGLSALSCQIDHSDDWLFNPWIPGLRRHFILIPDSFTKAKKDFSGDYIRLPISNNSDSSWLVQQILRSK